MKSTLYIKTLKSIFKKPAIDNIKKKGKGLSN